MGDPFREGRTHSSVAVLPNDTLSAVTHLLFNAQDYGFQITDFSASSSSTSKLPVSLQIRCWEAKELEKYFSAEQCTELRARKEERTRARMECLRLLEGMDDVEKMELLKGDKGDDRMKAAKRTVDVRVSVRCLQWLMSARNHQRQRSSG